MNKLAFKGSVILNPVPVVLITTKGENGENNVFTVAWTGTVCTHPPMLSISVRPERLSYKYIKETMEFVVNLPSSRLTKVVDFCGVRSGKTVDKIKEMNLKLEDSKNVSVSSLRECPVNIECKVREIIPLGTHDLILADVVGSSVDESLFDEKGKIHFEKADLIAYSHGEYFPLKNTPLGSFGYSVRKKKKEDCKKNTSTLDSKDSKKIKDKSLKSKKKKDLSENKSLNKKRKKNGNKETSSLKPFKSKK